ncbi:MAG: hypothetical protein NTZ08_08285, partial [Verrucomicrobia bacterium]|nr:hypothetical protein [Verrucomicrobiota bacterium]
VEDLPDLPGQAVDLGDAADLCVGNVTAKQRAHLAHAIEAAAIAQAAETMQPELLEEEPAAT